MPSTGTLTMHEFAEEYVANLEPREERFLTRLGDDFFVATFPNGIKTWVYLYEANGFTRRQTIGVYPEMNLQRALDTLYSVRRAQAVESELAVQGMDDPQVRMTEDSPINLTAKLATITLPRLRRRFLAGAMTGGGVVGLLATTAGWFFLANGQINEAPTAVAAAPVNKVVASSSDAKAQVEKTIAVETKSTVSQPVETAAVVTAKPVTAVKNQSEAQLALLRLQEDLAGTLASSQLTSAVQNGQPVDSLSWVIELDREPRRIFYFVRVRGLSGSKITYLWHFNGQLLKEEAVRVGKGWHSPAFSGMTLTAARLGHWRVELVGPDGQPLGTEEFETRMIGDTPQLSRR